MCVIDHISFTKLINNKDALKPQLVCFLFSQTHTRLISLTHNIYEYIIINILYCV